MRHKKGYGMFLDHIGIIDGTMFRYLKHIQATNLCLDSLGTERVRIYSSHIYFINKNVVLKLLKVGRFCVHLDQ